MLEASCLSGLRATAVLVLLSASALAHEIEEIDCDNELCGQVSNTPRTVLISVNPDPFPVVDPGEPQEAVVRWSVRFGLPATFEFCATAALGVGPSTADPCVDLNGDTVVYAGAYSTAFQDELSLPSTFYRPQAEFYIRTSSKIHLIGSAPETATSNRRAFVWPLPLPNLFAHNPDWDWINGAVHLLHDVTNQGPVAAGSSVTELQVNVCDGIANLPLIDPDDPSSERICAQSDPSFIQSFTEHVHFGPVPSGARVEEGVEVDGQLQLDQFEFGLWLSVTAFADVNNDVDESNEMDNTRFETLIVQ